jgi:hypothetical protein
MNVAQSDVYFKLANQLFEDQKSQVENVEIEKVEPRSIFETALQHNKFSVQMWESYLKFSMLHEFEQTNSIFERAITAVGKDFRSGDIWLMWIDFETSFFNMAKVNLLCYLALQ